MLVPIVSVSLVLPHMHAFFSPKWNGIEEEEEEEAGYIFRLVKRPDSRGQ